MNHWSTQTPSLNIDIGYVCVTVTVKNTSFFFQFLITISFNLSTEFEVGQLSMLWVAMLIFSKLWNFLKMSTITTMFWLIMLNNVMHLWQNYCLQLYYFLCRIYVTLKNINWSIKLQPWLSFRRKDGSKSGDTSHLKWSSPYAQDAEYTHATCW